MGIASQDVGHQGDAVHRATVDSLKIWDDKTIESVVFYIPDVDKVGFIRFELDVVKQNSIPLGNMRNNFISSSVAYGGQSLRLLASSVRVQVLF